jgi:hypothetical protein
LKAGHFFVGEEIGSPGSGIRAALFTELRGRVEFSEVRLP